MWIYLIEKKSEVITQFKKLTLHIEKQNECKLKKMRTNGGGEYTFMEFIRYFNVAGIDHEVIASYTSRDGARDFKLWRQYICVV